MVSWKTFLTLKQQQKSEYTYLQKSTTQTFGSK